MSKNSGRNNQPALPVDDYQHNDARLLLRPDVGTQAQFRKKKPPKTYRYDSSLAPELNWDGQNGARELGEWLIDCAKRASALPAPHNFAQAERFLDNRGEVRASVGGLQDALDQLARLSKPFLNWTGKAERLSFDVTTLPLFVHERLSTRAILETLQGHKLQPSLFDLFADPQHPISDQVLRAYEYQDNWVNRMILGDSLVVMNSLLEYEGMGGQVQMIYIDPPYGIQFGSNFQPFVRKREVVHNADDDLTREPEMVQAYRDTWELGLHSYLTYMRDRLILARDLLHSSGSIFVQISDENVHHMRELMDEIFGKENFMNEIVFQRSSGFETKYLTSLFDIILWYSKDKEHAKYHQLFVKKDTGELTYYDKIELPNGEIIGVNEIDEIPEGSRYLLYQPLVSSGTSNNLSYDFEFDGKVYKCGSDRHWKTTKEGLQKLVDKKRIYASENTIKFVRYHDDYPVSELSNIWTDTVGLIAKNYVVQTNVKILERCIQMTTDPGDLIIDPTCGSGTAAYTAEKWGRRWITIDVSRVPLALTRQRLLTATFPWFELRDENCGPSGGLVYKRKQNGRGEEVGGIVPHITLKSIANDEPPEEEVLVDRPEEISRTTRVTGPFTFEATIPTPMDWEQAGETTKEELQEGYAAFVDRMIEVLRRSPVLHLGGGQSVQLHGIRPPARSLALSAEATVDASAPGQAPSLMDVVDEAEEKSGARLPLTRKPVAIVFGPESGAVSEALVFEAAREASAKGYTYLYVIGFAIQPNARKLIDDCEAVVGVPAAYIQATPDLLMGDLLKNMRSSEIFSVCGLPEVRIHKNKDGQAQVELIGLDTFDPATMENHHLAGAEVPAWLLDSDYNGLCFHVSQAFFPRTGAWDNLKKSLKGQYEEDVWDHLSGTLSAPFLPGEHRQIAVKVIDDRGNELLVVEKL